MSLTTLERARSIIAAVVLIGAGVTGLHAQQIQRTRSPHGNLDIACQNCHASESWRPIRAVPDFSHDSQTEYPLLGQHKAVACASCHVNPVFSETETSCASCHADIHRRQFGASCEGCHTVRGWRINIDSVRQHANRFPLVGSHAATTCESCHRGAASGTFTGLSTACMSCHAADYAGTRTIDHRAAGFSTNCESCHSLNQWRSVNGGAQFDHSHTQFPLLGAHVSATCTSCHTQGKFAGTDSSCVSCHIREYGATTHPSHTAAAFSQDCRSCHTSVSWQSGTFNHSATRFALSGAHSSVQCANCHAGNRFAGTPTACSSCHVSAFNSSSNPNHVAAGFPQDCVLCHTTNAWRPAPAFDHSRTRFTLLGAHVSATCDSCHAQSRFTGTPSSCVSCHLSNFNGTAKPNHASAGFSQECQSCHTSVSWQGATFDHNRTRFTLTGAHGSVQCASCHVGNRFAGTPTDCSSCHASAFNSTTNPNHVAAGFPQTCLMCHSTGAWRPATFDHSRTRFTLLGAHASSTCTSCHAGGRFVGTPTACVSCHLAKYNATTSPNHVAAGFSQDCQSCHTQIRWQGATFDHSRTRFPLTGAHSGTTCVNCHVGNRFAGTPTACNSCHITAFNAATNPNHVTAGFPQDCLLCHGTTAWRPASFDHSRTRFPLMGAHTSTTCASCHVGGKYIGTPTTCVSCHLAKYNATTSPNHMAAGFPQECQLCHTAVMWQGAVFDHTRTRFPLTGAHTTVLCANCHVGNQFAGTPTACYGCHSSEFKTVTNPNHVAAGFPTTCESCHTTTTWSGATFTHKFPIYSGAHSGKWSSCNDCHSNASNYAVFTCLSCHAHERPAMDDKHKGRAGYVYDSLACYGCHPTGKH